MLRVAGYRGIFSDAWPVQLDQRRAWIIQCPLANPLTERRVIASHGIRPRLTGALRAWWCHAATAGELTLRDAGQENMYRISELIKP